MHTNAAKVTISIAFCLFLACAETPVFGSVIVSSSFGPGNTYNGAVGATVGDGAVAGNAGYSYAVYFTAAFTTPLESIVMGATHCGNGSLCGGIPPRDPSTNAVIMSLYDNGATGGGTLLESITVTGQMAPWVGQDNAIVTGLSTLHPLLAAGGIYWLVASVPNPLTDATVWSQALRLGQGNNPAYFRVGDGAWELYNGLGLAFQINGTSVPEPGTMSLLGAGIAALAVLRRRYFTASHTKARGQARGQPGRVGTAHLIRLLPWGMVSHAHHDCAGWILIHRGAEMNRHDCWGEERTPTFPGKGVTLGSLRHPSVTRSTPKRISASVIRLR